MWQRAFVHQPRILSGGASPHICPAWLPVHVPRTSHRTRCSATDAGVLREVRITLSENANGDVVLQNNVAPEAARLTSREPVYEQAAAADLASATAHAAVAAASKPATPDSELQDEIKECDCWEDVLDIVADEALQMSSSSIYIALRRLTLVTKGLPQSSTKQLVNKPSFQLLLQQMQRHLPAFDAVMLTNSLYSLSILRVPASKELLAAYDAQVETHLESFNMKDVVCCFYAYACLKHSPKKTLLDSMGLQAEHFLSSGAFNAQDISMLLWSCGTLHHKQADLINPLIIAALAKFDSFTTQGVANTTWALAKLESYSEPLMNKVADYISNSSNLRSARPQEVFNTLWGLAHLRHHPQQALPIVVDYTVRNMHRLRPVDLTNLVYSLGMLSHHPGAAAMGKLLPKLEADLEQFSVVELCNVYWGLALIEEVQAPLYVTMTDKLQALQQQGKLADSLQRMFFTGFLSAKLSGAAVALDPPVLEALKSAWISAMHASEPSRHLELVAKQLRALRVRHDMKKATKDGLSSIHIALNPTPERFVALQLVAEYDTAVNSGQLLGPLAFKRKLLERSGWEVKYLLVKDLEATPAEMLPLLLMDLMKLLGQKALPRSQSAATPAAKGRRGERSSKPARGVVSADEIERQMLDGFSGFESKPKTRAR